MTRTTHRHTWRKGAWLIVDERTGATHYADEMTREEDTGLLVHQRDADPRHPLLLLRPRYRDPEPVLPVNPAESLALTDVDRMLCGEVGDSGVDRTRPGPAEHLFQTGIGCMIIEGANEFTDFEVS